MKKAPILYLLIGLTLGGYSLVSGAFFIVDAQSTSTEEVKPIITEYNTFYGGGGGSMLDSFTTSSVETLIDYFHNTSDYISDISGSPNNLRGEWFSTSSDFEPSKILFNTSETGAGVLKLYEADTNGEPTGSLLCETTFNSSGTTYPAYGTSTATLTGCPILEASTKYLWYVYRTSGSIYVYGDNPSTYDQFTGSSDGGSTWFHDCSGTGCDLSYEVWGYIASESVTTSTATSSVDIATGDTLLYCIAIGFALFFTMFIIVVKV